MKTRAKKRKGLFGEDDTVSKMWIKTIPPTPFSKLRIVFFRSWLFDISHFPFISQAIAENNVFAYQRLQWSVYREEGNPAAMLQLSSSWAVSKYSLTPSHYSWSGRMKRKVTPTGTDTVSRFLQHQIGRLHGHMVLKEAIIFEQTKDFRKSVLKLIFKCKNHSLFFGNKSNIENTEQQPFCSLFWVDVFLNFAEPHG